MAARLSIDATLTLNPDERVCVIAPHCDDESLGAGGLIAAARDLELPVHVILMTNGDGFRAALGGELRRLKLAPQEYMRFAERRQIESLQALNTLGVGQDGAWFLGYPDQGLAAMWREYWWPSRPYRSPFTQMEYSPYTNSFSPGTPYSARSAIDDLKSIFRAARPTLIAAPHPHDAHGDHWASYCFTSYALAELQAEDPQFSHCRVVCYLVHRGGWPSPRRYRPRLSLQPPASFLRLGWSWQSFSVAERHVERKHRAILHYKSQLGLLRRLLLSFVRQNELFSVYPELSAPTVPAGSILVDGLGDDWPSEAASVQDPVRDTFTRSVERSADIVELAICVDETNIYLRLKLRWRVVNEVGYTFTLVPYGLEHETECGGGDESNHAPLNIGFRARDRVIVKEAGHWRGTRHLVGRSSGRTIELAIPRIYLRSHGALISVETRYRGFSADRTTWQSVSWEVDP